MNFNDINSRLDRLYLSIGQIRNSNIEDSYKIVHSKNGNQCSVSFSFDNGFNENEALNKILLIIHNISNLKDHLKNIILMDFGDNISPRKQTSPPSLKKSCKGEGIK